MRSRFASSLRWSRWILALALALAAVSASSPALAAPTPAELAHAREDFRKGMQLEAANDWAGALARFEAVAQIAMSPAVRFHTARCQHRLGKLLEALGGYRLAAYEASNDPKLATDPKLAEVLREAQAGIVEVEERVPKLIIRRGVGAEAASVQLDGVALGEASIGNEVQVNPGGHTIRYALQGKDFEEKVVTLQEGDSQTIELAFEVAPKPVAKKPAPTLEEPLVVAPQEKKSNVLPWVVMGAGGASLLASGVFYGLRSSAISDHDSQCVNNVCPGSLRATGDSGKSYTTVGNVTLGLGILGLGVGTVLLLTGGDQAAPAHKTEAASASMRPRMTVVVGGSRSAAEASLVGTF